MSYLVLVSEPSGYPGVMTQYFLGGKVLERSPEQLLADPSPLNKYDYLIAWAWDGDEDVLAYLEDTFGDDSTYVVKLH